MKAWLGALPPLALLLAWEFAARQGVAPRFLSSPVEVLLALREMIDDGEFATHLAASARRLAVGLAIGTTLGLIAGLAAGRIGAVRWLLDPLVAFVNPIPKIAFLPIVVLLLGIGHASKVAIISLSVFFPLYLAAEQASRSVDPRLLWVARNTGAGRWRSFVDVILPASLPAIFAGLRVGLALSFVSLFAAELMGAADGMGQLIASGEEYQRYDIMLAGILSFAAAGFLADRMLGWLGGRLVRG